MGQVEILTGGMNIQQEDKRAVLQIPIDLDRAWNRRDPEAYAALFDEDADFRFHDGLWIQGRNAIKAFWGERVFPGSSAGMRHIVTSNRLRFITEDVAIGEGVVRIVDRSGEQEVVHLDTQGTLLAVKRAGQWLISAVRLAEFIK
jgi:uncharacterized protein (TIGR02246 family)